MKGRWIEFLGAAPVAAVSVFLSPGPAPAASDPSSGRQIAQRWCASCHLVTPQQTSASADVPSFQSIAQREDLTESLLTAFLSSSHPRMPDMSLSRREISDLVAYVRSLR
jgi:mono/diheme cytochrome c family protein